jgi:hypothetical protein
MSLVFFNKYDDDDDDVNKNGQINSWDGIKNVYFIYTWYLSAV